MLVDQSTGTVTLRARFANPQSILLPGMFVTAEFAQAIDTSAFLVPQQAVSRDPQGNATLFVVGPGNRAVQRTVVADRTQGPYWVVTQGLAPGEKVITQGTANLRDGAQIKPVPASAPQPVKAPPPGAMKPLQAASAAAKPTMARIFIERPIFAWVLAIIIMLGGIGAIFSLPVAQYPDVAPTQINVRATYPGASAETLESSVTQVIEETLTGLDGLLYFSSSSSSRGQVSITAVFDKSVDPDIAQVQVQNKVQTAIARLPQQVQQQGVTVTKGSPDFLMIVGVYDETDKTTNVDVSDWLATNIQDDLSRIQGVGDVNVFGSQICDARCGSIRTSCRASS